MNPLYDVWPFNTESGPAFLFLYAAFGIAGFFASLGLARFIGRGRTPAPSAPPAQPPQPYRAAPHVVRERLRVGWVPQPDEYWAIAHLRGGASGVQEMLIVTAVAQGWLTQDGDSFRVSHAELGPGPLRTFYEKLTSAKLEKIATQGVRNAALATANEHATAIESELVDAGLRRDGGTRWRIWLSTMLLGTIVGCIGLIRCVRAEELGRPYELLVVEMVVFTIATLVTAGVLASSSKTSLGDEYLAWLDSATHSLRGDVAAGRRTGAGEVALAVALGGAAAVAAAPIFVPMYTFLFPPQPVASSGGSSCSSSSCGGGGEIGRAHV